MLPMSFLIAAISLGSFLSETGPCSDKTHFVVDYLCGVSKFPLGNCAVLASTPLPACHKLYNCRLQQGFNCMTKDAFNHIIEVLDVVLK